MELLEYFLLAVMFIAQKDFVDCLCQAGNYPFDYLAVQNSDVSQVKISVQFCHSDRQKGIIRGKMKLFVFVALQLGNKAFVGCLCQDGKSFFYQSYSSYLR